MMGVKEELGSSWADEVEGWTGGDLPPPSVDLPTTGGDLPPPSQVVNGQTKLITEYKFDEDSNKKVKIVRTYKVEKRIVSKSIAMRKTWNKYGIAKGDKPGPNPASTIIAEDVFMQFISSREEPEKLEEDPLDKLKNLTDRTVKCRLCSGDHWTRECPFKDTNFKLLENKNPAAPSPTPPPQEDKDKTGKYVPPVLRDGGRRAEGIRRDEQHLFPIRISNLSEATQDQDLEELVRHFGPYGKIYLAKDHVSGRCKGFAFVHFKVKSDAAKAIQTLNGYGYDHLILQVDWSKPTNPS